MRKAKPFHSCLCGCGGLTKGTWVSGHDGRATGWALRVERGALTLADVPVNERNGAMIMLTRHGFGALVNDFLVVPADIKFLRVHGLRLAA